MLQLEEPQFLRTDDASAAMLNSFAALLFI
jgi:hypothetical protein